MEIFISDFWDKTVILLETFVVTFFVLFLLFSTGKSEEITFPYPLIYKAS